MKEGFEPMKRISHSLACASLLLTLAAGAKAQIVSFHFFGANIYQPPPQVMAPTEVAGVRAVANWNNMTGNSTNGTPVALVDSTGSASPLSVEYEAPNTWACYYGDSNGNRRMMRSYLDSADVLPTTVTVHGLSATKSYLVYVYVDPADLNDKGTYTIGNQTFQLTNPVQFDGVTFTQVTSTDVNAPGAGNYMIFNVAGQTDFTLSAQTNTTLGGYRAPVNALQVVTVNPAGAPKSLAANAGTGRVTLYWIGDPNAETYNVKRSASASGPFTTVGSTGATNYTDTTVTNGTKYYYEVTSVNSSGESGPSNIAFATPQPGLDGVGLTGSYYTQGPNVGSPTFNFFANTPTLTQIDPVISLDVDGNNGTVPPAGVPHDNFSVQWAGAVQIPLTGDYVFETASDDGSRLFLDGNLIVDNYNFQAVNTVPSAPITLMAGSKHILTYLFFQGTGGGEAHLYWKIPGQTVQTTPQFALIPGYTIAGQASLEGVPDLGATNPAAPLGTLHVSLRAPGTTNELYALNAGLITTAGSVNGSYFLTGIPVGKYDLLIKGAKNLAVLVPGVNVTTTTAVLPGIQLPAGDANGDNSVDSSDFTALIGSFNSDATLAGSGYDPTADFNFDGFVDSSDFTLLIGEFNNTGDK